MAIAHFPVELWHDIFAFACTDGGPTGSALSLVSRYIHECAKPFKLHSVALHGTRQTAAFVEALQRTPAPHAGVRHLFISSDEPSARGRDVVGSTNANSKPSVWGALTVMLARIPSLSPARAHDRPDRDPRNLSEVLDRDVALTRALLAILAVAGPTLRTLTIAFECHWVALRTPSPFPLPSTHSHTPNTNNTNTNGTPAPMLRLPALTDLTLAYRAPTDAAFNEFVFRAPLAGALPALTHLDLSGLKLLSYRFAPQLCGRLGALAPRLTHVLIPTRMALAGIVGSMPPPPPAESVESVCAASPPSPSSSEKPEPHGTHLPPTIRRVLIALSGPDTYICRAAPRPSSTTTTPTPSPVPSSSVQSSSEQSSSAQSSAVHAPSYGRADEDPAAAAPCTCWRCQLLGSVAADARIAVLAGRAGCTWAALLARCEAAWAHRAGGGVGAWDEGGAVR